MVVGGWNGGDGNRFCICLCEEGRMSNFIVAYREIVGVQTNKRDDNKDKKCALGTVARTAQVLLPLT